MKAKEEVENLQRKLASGELPHDEPIFVLRARDKFAARAVEYWCDYVMANAMIGQMTAARKKVKEAMKIVKFKAEEIVE